MHTCECPYIYAPLTTTVEACLDKAKCFCSAALQTAFPFILSAL